MPKFKKHRRSHAELEKKKKRQQMREYKNATKDEQIDMVAMERQVLAHV